MAKDGEDKNELDDLWRELTEPRSLEGSMSDMLPSKDASADAKDGRAMLGKLVLGKFRIDKFLDGGSVGRIYSGTQLGLGRPVAIKVLRRQDGPRGELAKKRFVREAEFLASMSHPNVVEMIGFGETEDGHVVMVMEKLEGHNLKEHLEQEGPMPVLRVIHIARQLAEAVCRAHELGGVHRDLKPANVFIERDDRDRDLVKVLDFGLVKPSSKRSNKNASLTLSGFVLGTPFYMSPEQAMGETLDARADIYSFGIMLYEMLTGVPPFRGNTVAEILAKHLEANPPPLAANNPRLNAPVQLETLIRGCLAKSPKDRPESMYTVVHELDAIERAQKHLDADLQATLAGWDPNRASGDFPAPPVVDAAPPGPWREPSVTSAETWTERTQPPLVQPVNEPSNSASANAPWNEASAPPPDWNERSNNPWADRSGAAGDWSEHSLTPFPQGASPQAPATRPAFGAPPQPLALPATVPTSSSDEDLWSHAPNSSNPPLEDSNSKALVPFNQGGALLPPPSISSTPAELEPAARLGFLKHKGRSLLLLLAGIIMIALALGLVRWAENSFNEQEAQSAPARPRGEMPQGHIDRAPTASPAMPKA